MNILKNRIKMLLNLIDNTVNQYGVLQTSIHIKNDSEQLIQVIYHSEFKFDIAHSLNISLPLPTSFFFKESRYGSTPFSLLRIPKELFGVHSFLIKNGCQLVPASRVFSHQISQNTLIFLL